MLNKSDGRQYSALEVALLPDGQFSRNVRDTVKAEMARRSSLLCCLTAGGRIVLADVSESNPPETKIDGTHTDFVWESEPPQVLGQASHRLLTVGPKNELWLYVMGLQGTELEPPVCAAGCSAGALLQVAKETDQRISELLSLRVLSFTEGRCCVLVNGAVLLQLLWPDGAPEPEKVPGCILALPAEALDRSVDFQMCRGVLFILADAGQLYVLCCASGALLASVDLTLCQAGGGSGEADPAQDAPSFRLFRVSQDLSTLVVACADCAWAIDLSDYFSPSRCRSHPEHLLHRAPPTHLPLQALGALDQDGLSSAQHSVAALGVSLRIDRSWEAQLAILYNKARTPGAPPQKTKHPWFKDILHVECQQAAVGAGLFRSAAPAGGATVQFELEDGAAPVALAVTEFSAVVTFTTPDGHGSAVAFWDPESQRVSYCRPSGWFVPVRQGAGEHASLLLKDSGLSLLLFGVSQEELLNRLMVFGSAGTADSLCHLNAWDRCSIPIHALQAGLKNHQLDTVDFFLKSKENFLCPRVGFGLPEHPATVSTLNQLKNVQALCPALDLLSSAIRDTHSESQSKQFSEQLLNITLTFLNTRVQEILSDSEEPDENLQQCLVILNKYICDLRVFMKRFPWPVGGAGPQEPAIQEVDAGPAVVPDSGPEQIWHSLSTEEVVLQAVMANEIPRAQAYLKTRNCAEQNLSELRATGLQLAFQCLERRDLDQAKCLLRNMGFSVKEQLRKVCLHTDDVELRDFVVEELRRLNFLSDEEEGVVHFIKQLEGLRLMPATRYRSSVRKSTLQMEQISPESRRLLEALGVAPGPRASQAMWTSVRMDWVRHWDQNTRRSILMSRVQDHALRSCDPAVLWLYLTSLHDRERITRWLERLPEADEWPALTADIVNEHTACCGYLRDEVLDMLARKGIFTQAELLDFEQLLWRLGQAGGVMQDRSPVPHFRSPQGLDFHACFIRHCLENGLRYLLYSYTQHYRLTPENCAALADTSLHESYPWFEMMVKVQEITRNLNEPEAVFQASLTNAQILTPGSPASVSSMLLEGHSLLALSTIMFAPGGIDQVVSAGRGSGDSPGKVDLQLLKMALTPYPKLKSALFPPSGLRGTPPSDITLYQLMQSLHPLDPSRLFHWQSANTLGNGDALELPHFSSPQLVAQHALVERLDFLYYLRHGRPASAFGTFLLQQLAASSDPQLQVALGAQQAYALALRHFHAPPVASACACFCEMLGVGSLKLRVDVAALSLVLRSQSQGQEEASGALRDSLVDRASGLQEREGESAQQLLVHLEAAVRDSVERKSLGRSSYEAGKEWALAVQFCQLHHLPLTPAYLSDCAADAQWLNFLVFIQLHSYPPQQARALVAQFDPTLQAHLSLAFQRLQPEQDDCLGGAEPEPPAECPPELFQVLLRSREQRSPWRHLLSEGLRLHCPLLAVLAACHKDADLIHSLCVWILTSVDDGITLEATAHLRESVRHHSWGLHDLSIIWRTLLRNRKVRPLIRGFQLFQKDCPLGHMLQMYEMCCDYKNYQVAKQKLLEFQKCLMNLKGSCTQPSGSIPTQWSESQASVLLLSMLQQSSMRYELHQLLRLLADVDHLLKSNGPDFKKLSLLSDILLDTPVPLSQTLLEDYSPDALQGECLRLVEQLQAHGLFSQARRVSELADLPIDSLLVSELQQELQNLKTKRQWSRKETRIAFWRRCHEQFSSNTMGEQVASAFFQDQARPSEPAPQSPAEEELHCVQERLLLLALAGHWLCRLEPAPLEELQALERQMWECRVRQQELVTAMEQESLFALPVVAAGDGSFEDVMKEFSFSKATALNRPENLDPEGLPAAESPGPRLGPEGRAALAALVGRLLDEGSINEASRVCRYFGYYQHDVALVLRCRCLASGEGPPLQELPPTADSPDANGDPKRSFASSSSFSSLCSFVVVSQPEDHISMQLQKIADECLHGKSYCKQVLSLYELSKELKVPYSQISAEEPQSVLCKVLLSQQPDRYKKAQAFIAVQSLGAEVVAELVSKAVIQGLLASEEVGSGEKQIYSPTEGREAFLQLARLCGDPNLVGTMLLDHIPSMPLVELACTVELLILAHDCFSITCNMEGIVRVLQAARHLSHAHLAHSDRYSLLVRLLTGIGRYNEMTYIFDLLNQSHRFEMLLRKKEESNSMLKTALLDYLRRCLPGDSEKHNMVALCFSMRREIGENHEAAARTQLKLIESQPWAVTPELKSALVKVLTLLKDAAESYSKDSCVRQGVRCVKLAKLVTLQLHILNQGQEQQVINLRTSELPGAIAALPRCYQAFVLAEAYDFAPDWAEVLYQKVVRKGDFAYLEEFKRHQQLQASLFEEISKKVSHSKSPTEVSQNLKKLLEHCEDIYTYYKLAYEHKFFDVANLLLQKSNTSSYLNDRLAS
ncbi:spatacsin isoform X1 [Paramormyrops kingsleyae]|uniref:spatacsin isoform X1 n=1 Tax=Paramormyrops kingsleyae TaxID=1676925 RepID=UPI000CD66686|nr:spatacsin isoform X2 [Paramormyrops kingsleyae]